MFCACVMLMGHTPFYARGYYFLKSIKSLMIAVSDWVLLPFNKVLSVSLSSSSCDAHYTTDERRGAIARALLLISRLLYRNIYAARDFFSPPVLLRGSGKIRANYRHCALSRSHSQRLFESIYIYVVIFFPSLETTKKKKNETHFCCENKQK